MLCALEVLKGNEDLIISDLPVGYYPDDQIASRSMASQEQEHTFIIC